LRKLQILTLTLVVVLIAAGGFLLGEQTASRETVTLWKTVTWTEVSEKPAYVTLTEKTTITRTETFTATETLTVTLTVKAPPKTVTVRLAEVKLRDPTWEELKEFLKQDDTNEMVYKLHEFDCTGFAIMLRDHAWARGYRCAFVDINFKEGGHNINAFQTVDKGLVYVDTVNGDAIAYVEVGKPYGVIALEAVKWRYIDCSVYQPDEFWKPLIYVEYPEDSRYPLTYSYYLDYQRRVAFYHETVKAYNRAVEAYNRGEGNLTYEQLTSWAENIEKLSQELGPTIYEPSETVQSIEIYWNSLP